jgi:hypothetical protein
VKSEVQDLRLLDADAKVYFSETTGGRVYADTAEIELTHAGIMHCGYANQSGHSGIPLAFGGL